MVVNNLSTDFHRCARIYDWLCVTAKLLHNRKVYIVLLSSYIITSFSPGDDNEASF